MNIFEYIDIILKPEPCINCANLEYWKGINTNIEISCSIYKYTINAEEDLHHVNDASLMLYNRLNYTDELCPNINFTISMTKMDIFIKDYRIYNMGFQI